MRQPQRCRCLQGPGLVPAAWSLGSPCLRCAACPTPNPLQHAGAARLELCSVSASCTRCLQAMEAAGKPGDGSLRRPCLQAPTSLAHVGVPPRLIARWRECNPSAAQQDRSAAGAPEEEGRFVSAEQRAFFGMLASYKDVVFPLRPYPTR